MAQPKPESPSLKLEGSFTVFEVAELRNRLIALLATPSSRCIDVTRLDYMDTSCVQVLLAAVRRRGAERPFEIVGLRPEVKRHLDRLNCVLS